MLVGAESRRSVASFIPWFLAVMLAATTAIIVSPTPVAAAGFSCASDGPTYTVRAGDGWFAIAARADVSARSLLEANGAAADDVIVPGDRLCLPDGADVAAVCGSSYTVRAGDGWFTIARRFGVSATALVDVNGVDLGRIVHPGQTVCLPDGASSAGATTAPGAAPVGTSSYTIARGDSWFGVAARAGVSAKDLLAVNNSSAADVIVPGDVILLPAGARRPTSNSSTQRVDLEALPLQAPCWYSDTWRAARSGGRRHRGTDIFTGARNYVYAVVDGRLTGRGWAQPGQISGNSWTLTAADGTFFFYAHLSDFNPALRVGSRVEAGEIIGWVGSTGNASSAHLHFEVHPGGGEAVNPYPILRAEGGCNRGRPYTQPGGWIPD